MKAVFKLHRLLSETLSCLLMLHFLHRLQVNFAQYGAFKIHRNAIKISGKRTPRPRLHLCGRCASGQKHTLTHSQSSSAVCRVRASTLVSLRLWLKALRCKVAAVSCHWRLVSQTALLQSAPLGSTVINHHESKQNTCSRKSLLCYFWVCKLGHCSLWKNR